MSHPCSSYLAEKTKNDILQKTIRGLIFIKENFPDTPDSIDELIGRHKINPVKLNGKGNRIIKNFEFYEAVLNFVDDIVGDVDPIKFTRTQLINKFGMMSQFGYLPSNAVMNKSGRMFWFRPECKLDYSDDIWGKYEPKNYWDWYDFAEENGISGKSNYAERAKDYPEWFRFTPRHVDCSYDISGCDALNAYDDIEDGIFFEEIDPDVIVGRLWTRERVSAERFNMHPISKHSNKFFQMMAASKAISEYTTQHQKTA